MVCADNSVWVAALRGRPAGLAGELGERLDADQIMLPPPVRLELLAGSPTSDQPRLARDLSAIPLLVPQDATWERVERWCMQAVRAGERFGFADLLIAALAAEAATPLRSLEGDFARMAALGFVERYRPR